MAIDTADFSPVPVILFVALTGWAFLVFLRRYGHRWTPEDKPFLDTVVDIAVLITGASIAGALSSTPALSSLSSSIAARVSSWSFGDALQIGGGSLVLAALIVLGIFYTKNEKLWQLTLFSIGVLVAAILLPLIYDILNFWLNYPVRLFWNFVIGIVSWVVNQDLSF